MLHLVPLIAVCFSCKITLNTEFKTVTCRYTLVVLKYCINLGKHSLKKTHTIQAVAEILKTFLCFFFIELTDAFAYYFEKVLTFVFVNYLQTRKCVSRS